MPVTLRVTALPSNIQGVLYTYQMQGWVGDLKKLFSIVGGAASAPALVSDLTGAQANPVLLSFTKSINIQPGSSSVSGTDSASVSGAAGDLLWVCMVEAAGSAPVGTDPLVAVAGPFTIQP